MVTPKQAVYRMYHEQIFERELRKWVYSRKTFTLEELKAYVKQLKDQIGNELGQK